MESIKNGETERAEESLQSNLLGREGGMGRTRANSETDGYNSFPDHEGRTTGENWINQFFTDGHPDFAKVLERLLEIELEHFAYVDAHQERLKARLNESTESKKRIYEKIVALRGDIQEIIGQGQE